jgi:hypothetical protein
MTAYNVVRFRVKPGRDKDFIAKNQEMGRTKMRGFRKGALIKTGDRAYCFMAEWDSFDSIVKARPQMLANLDSMRDLLEDLGGGLGVTDPISGEAVLEINP